MSCPIQKLSTRLSIWNSAKVRKNQQQLCSLELANLAVVETLYLPCGLSSSSLFTYVITEKDFLFGKLFNSSLKSAAFPNRLMQDSNVEIGWLRHIEAAEECAKKNKLLQLTCIFYHMEKVKCKKCVVMPLCHGRKGAADEDLGDAVSVGPTRQDQEGAGHQIFNNSISSTAPRCTAS